MTGSTAIRARTRSRKPFTNTKEQERLQEWPARARKEGWPDDVDNPGKLHSGLDLLLQRSLSGILLLVGGASLFSFIRWSGRWIAFDDGKVTTSWGASVPVESVKDLDLSRWKTKGIAVLNYDEQGRSGRVVLDDWKYDREKTERLVNELKSALGMADEA